MTQFVFYLADYRMRVIKRSVFSTVIGDFSDASLFLEHRPAIVAFFIRDGADDFRFGIENRQLPSRHRQFRYPRECRLISREKHSNPRVSYPGRNAVLRLCPRFRP